MNDHRLRPLALPSARWPAPGDSPTSRRLDGWSEGYTTDVVYTDEFSFDLHPAWLSMIAVFHGQPPLPEGRRLVWLDLGCGTGIPACTVAAANPDIEVWGVDYNPAHIERARRLAEAAQLPNCTFVEASFEAAATDLSVGPGQVDIAICNGVYSWVSPANRSNIVEAIGRRLSPGGLAYIMYETAPGWCSMVPLAEALRLLVDADGRSGEAAFHDAARQIVTLRDGGARYFPIGPLETSQVDSWSTARGRYAAHEYLGANFNPLHVDDVVASMAEQKCALLGSIHPLDHHPYYSTPIEFAELLSGDVDPLARELVRDIVLQTALRRDIYRRGRAFGTEADVKERIRSLRFCGLGVPLAEEPVPAPAMQITLDSQFHGPLIAALSERVLGVDDVLSIHPSWTFSDAATALALLVAGGYASPVRHEEPSEEAVAAVRRFNAVLAAERRNGHQHSGVVSPVTGSTIELDLVEVLALDAIREGAEEEQALLVDIVAAEFEAQGLTVRQKGELVTDPDAARSILEQRVSNLVERLPALRRLGVA